MRGWGLWERDLKERIGMRECGNETSERTGMGIGNERRGDENIYLLIKIALKKCKLYLIKNNSFKMN